MLPPSRRVSFANGIIYQSIIEIKDILSTLPLNHLVKMRHVSADWEGVILHLLSNTLVSLPWLEKSWNLIFIETSQSAYAGFIYQQYIKLYE